jgi:hypothetical protein
VHRRIGWATVALAGVMVVVGTTAGIWSMRRQVEAGFEQQAQAFLTTPLFSMIAFAALVAMAIRLRRDPQSHKRLMLLATISILDAAVARLPLADIFLAVAILYDIVSRHAVHRVYLWGGLLLVVEQALRIPIGETAAWQAIAAAILK